MSEYESPIKWFAIAQKNQLNGGYARFGDRLTLKSGPKGPEENSLQSQGVEERPQKILEFLTLESGSPKNGLL